MTSLREKLKEFHKSQWPEWINGGVAERIAMDNGFKASNASRRMRELVEDGTLERRLNGKRCVEYRYKKLLDRVLPPAYPKVEQRVGMF